MSEENDKTEERLPDQRTGSIPGNDPVAYEIAWHQPHLEEQHNLSRNQAEELGVVEAYDYALFKQLEAKWPDGCDNEALYFKPLTHLHS